MEMALLVSVIAAVLAIFSVYRTAKEILKHLSALEVDRRKPFRRFILSGSSLASVLILIMAASTAWVAMEKEGITELQADTDKKLQEAQAGLNKTNQELATARRRGGDEFSKAYQDAVKRAGEATAKAAEFDSEDNRTKLGEKFEAQKKALGDDAQAKLQAIVDHVERWRQVTDGLRESMSIGVKMMDAMGPGAKMIDDALKKGDLAGAAKALSALKEAQEADAAKIKAALDAASTPPPAPPKPAAAAAAPAAAADAPAKAEAKK